MWDGTSLAIDGGEPVNLKGEKGDGSSWADLTGKPETYPSTVADVDGIVVDTSAGTRVSIGGVDVFYDSGWRNVGTLLLNGWKAYAYPSVLRRVGATCELRAYLDKTVATDDRFLDSINGFRLGTSTRAVGTAYGSTTTNSVSFTQNSDGFSLLMSRMPQNQMMVSMIWTTNDPIPTTLPGTPA